MATLALRPITRRRQPGPHTKRHVPYEHPEVPGVCHTCRLPIVVDQNGDYVNQRHVTLDQLLSQMVTSDYDVMLLAAGDG